MLRDFIPSAAQRPIDTGQAVKNNPEINLPAMARLLGLGILWPTLPTAAQTGPPPLSVLRQVQPLSAVEQIVLPPTDAAVELAADQARGVPTPVCFRVAHKVTISPSRDLRRAARRPAVAITSAFGGRDRPKPGLYHVLAPGGRDAASERGGRGLLPRPLYFARQQAARAALDAGVTRRGKGDRAVRARFT